MPLWHKLQELSQQPAARFFKKLIGDPVQLYAVFLVTTVMHYYHSGMTWLYTVFAVLISWLMMRFYDFVAKHKLIGPLTYIVYLFAGLEIVRMITNYGQIGYPISFMVWFLTPQSVVTFSAWYTISIYFLMLGFLTSAVYYFSKIRYRMSMQFLIMLIPLSLYAKEGIHMPAVLVIILLASFFLLMVYCRQLRNPEEIRYLPSFHGSMSIAVYVLVFSITAAIIPKPALTADREFIENAMSYSTWSDVLMNAISMFTDTTDNSFSTSNNTRTIYYVASPEALRLRTQTYSYYQSDDSWSVIREYDYPDQDYETGSKLTYRPQDVLQAILDAAAQDTDFAETYQLSDLAGTVLTEQNLQTVSLCCIYYPTQILPSPTRIVSPAVSAGNRLTVSETNTFGGSISGWTDIRYYSDTYARYGTVLPVLQRLSGSEYETLLQDAQAVLEKTAPEESALLTEIQQEYQEAYAYLHTVHAQDFDSDVIKTLAEQITAGLDSDFDKARAIENYFVKEGFVYDQSYQKPAGSNAEYFLTESKTGVCYEFATAMVMLCRSIGLPARYVQGYNLNQMYDGNFRNRDCNYLIKVRDAHAFPEVYISGYGWLSFEPTVSSMDLPEAGTAENQNVTRWGFILLGFGVIAGIVYFFLPRIREKLFRKRISRLSPAESAAAVFLRMRHVMHLPESTTVRELAEASLPFFAEPEFFSALDVLLYSHVSEADSSVMTSQQIALQYQKWQDDRIQFLKDQAKQRRQEAKLNRQKQKTQKA